MQLQSLLLVVGSSLFTCVLSAAVPRVKNVPAENSTTLEKRQYQYAAYYGRGDWFRDWRNTKQNNHILEPAYCSFLKYRTPQYSRNLTMYIDPKQRTDINGTVFYGAVDSDGLEIPHSKAPPGAGCCRISVDCYDYFLENKSEMLDGWNGMQDPNNYMPDLYKWTGFDPGAEWMQQRWNHGQCCHLEYLNTCQRGRVTRAEWAHNGPDLHMHPDIWHLVYNEPPLCTNQQEWPWDLKPYKGHPYDMDFIDRQNEPFNRTGFENSMYIQW